MSETALDAYWNFFDAFNSRDARRFSEALHYPHVRVSPRGKPVVVPSIEDHAESITWDRAVETGWNHSEGMEPTTVHAGADRVHLAGGWTRFDNDGKPIVANHVLYVMTKGALGWGIQSRFGIDGEPSTEHHDAAVELVENYIEAFNQRDWETCAQCMRFPTFKVDVAQVREWDDERAVVNALADGPWHFHTEKAVRVVQAGARAASVATENVIDGGDQIERAVFYLVDDDGWGIAARSIIDG